MHFLRDHFFGLAKYGNEMIKQRIWNPSWIPNRKRPKCNGFAKHLTLLAEVDTVLSKCIAVPVFA